MKIYRCQKGFIFNGDMFVVNKEDVCNARNEDLEVGWQEVLWKRNACVCSRERCV